MIDKIKQQTLRKNYEAPILEGNEIDDDINNNSSFDDDIDDRST